MAYKIPAPAQSLVLDAPAHKMAQAGRPVYYLSLRMEQFDDTVPTEVNAETIGDHQRRFVESHARAISEYLRSADDWIFGPITLTVDPDYVRFEPYETEDPSGRGGELPVLGQLHLTEGARSRLRIIDGQHRRRAIRDFLKEEGLPKPLADRQRRFRDSQMPIAIYEEGDTRIIRQMFADIAKQRGIDAVTTARFDERDPYNRAADRVMRSVPWLQQFVEMNRSRVRADSEKLLSFNQLANLLKTKEVGYGGRISRARRIEALRSFDTIVRGGVAWFTGFLAAARPEYEELVTAEPRPDYLPLRRADSLAYSYTMLRILAACHFAWLLAPGEQDESDLASFIRSVDLKPGQTEGLLVEAQLLEPNGTTLVARPQDVKPAIRFIVDRASGTFSPGEAD